MTQSNSLQIITTKNTSIIPFDMDFFPSLLKELLLNNINHTRSFIHIRDEQLEIILNRRKSTIHSKNSTWIKITTEILMFP